MNSELLSPNAPGSNIGPPSFETCKKLFQAPCSECGEVYFVDKPTFDWLSSFATFEADDRSFVCKKCSETGRGRLT